MPTALSSGAAPPATTLQHGHVHPGKRSGEFRRRFYAWVVESEAVAVAFALSVCVGAALYMSAKSEPAWSVLAGPAGLSLVARSLVRRWSASAPLGFAFLLVLGMSAGGLAGKVRTHLVAAPKVHSAIGPVMVEGWVVGIEPGAAGPRLRLRVHAIQGLAKGDTPRLLRVTHANRLDVGPGRFVRCWSVLRPPPGPSIPGDYDFRRQAYFSRLGAVGYVQGRCRGGVLGPPENFLEKARLSLATARRTLGEHVQRAAGPRAGGFAAALVSGDRSFMSNADQDALRASGLAHLLAISGLHMGIVGGLVFLIVRRSLALIEPLALRAPVSKLAAAAALIASLVYLVISGASVSTQRAFIMTSVFLIAVLIDRKALSLRTFSIAMILVAISQPESVIGPGFQMSFAATGALVAVFDAWGRRRAETPRAWLATPIFAVQSIFVSSATATAATAPFAIFHFDRVAPLGLAANLLAMPVISFLAAPAAALALILSPLGLDGLGLRAFGASLEAVLAVAHAVADASPQTSGAFPRLPALAFLLMIAAIASFVLARGRWRVRLSGLVVAGGAGLWSVHPQPDLYWSPSGALFVASETGGHVRYDVVDGDGLDPLRFTEARTLAPPLAFTSSRGLIRLADPARADNTPSSGPTLIVADLEGRAKLKLSWRTVAETGGVAIRLRGDRDPVVEFATRCGARAWSRRPNCAPP